MRNECMCSEGLQSLPVRFRLHVVLLLALALALILASGASTKWTPGKTSVTASGSILDDDPVDVAAVVPQPLLVVALVFGLILVALGVTSSRGVSASEPRRARAPPSR